MTEYANARAKARKPPAPEQAKPARKGLRYVSKDRAKLMKTLSPERCELKVHVGCCMKCRKALGPAYLDAHEIANGAAREDCMDEPLLVMVLCRKCHNRVQGQPPAKQIALHFRWLIDVACAKYCDLTGTAPTHVVGEDVVTFLMMGKREPK